MLYRSLILCESAIVDARSNSLSLINILEEIQALGFPTLVPHLSVVTILQKEPTDSETRYPFSLRIQLNNKELFTQEVIADFMDKPKTRLILDMMGFPINTQGTLSVELLHEGNIVMSSSIEVTLPQKPAVTQRSQEGNKKQ